MIGTALTRGWAVGRFTFHLEVIGGRFLRIPGRIQTQATEEYTFIPIAGYTLRRVQECVR